MMELWASILASVTVALLSGGGAWYAARAVNKKAPAEIITALSEGAVNLVDPLNQRIDSMEDELKAIKAERQECQAQILRLEGENNLLLRWANVLIEQVIKNGGVPVLLEDIRRLDK